MDDRFEVLADIPPAPNTPPDLDAIGDRYTALCEARAAVDPFETALLESACADDVPALVAEISRLHHALTTERYGRG